MEQRVRLRSAVAGDEARYLRWVNDPAVRASAVRTDPVGPAGHARWFARRLADPRCLLLVAELGDDQEPVGQVRLELVDPPGDEAKDARVEVDVSLDRAARGRGLAGPLLVAAVARSRERWPGVDVVALVRPDNAASMAAFRRAGFVADGTTARHGVTLTVLRATGGRR